MTRTAQQRNRRERLADASIGITPPTPGLTRAGVVLYASPRPGERVGPVLRGLRAYAEAREWAVVDVLVDRVPLSTPTTERPLWPRVADLIAARQAQGVVTDVPETEITSDCLGHWHAFIARVNHLRH
ncbi:hypothetical protein [Streptomyces sp. NPDC088182]|uniref:hypothetical protein n=1 Tax=Streptomyces sp. NPDC088182 TaxID=3365838 RepID=UPI003811B389